MSTNPGLPILTNLGRRALWARRELRRALVAMGQRAAGVEGYGAVNAAIAAQAAYNEAWNSLQAAKHIYHDAVDWGERIND